MTKVIILIVFLRSLEMKFETFIGAFVYAMATVLAISLALALSKYAFGNTNFGAFGVVLSCICALVASIVGKHE